MGLKKSKSVSKIFRRYIVYFCVCIIVTFVFVIGTDIFLMYKGEILPANYYERYLERNAVTISESENPRDYIPSKLTFAVYDENGNYIDGNIKNGKEDLIYDESLDDKALKVDNSYFKKITGGGRTIIVFYDIKSTFKNDYLNALIPNEELFSIILLMVLFIIEVIMLSISFRNRIAVKMETLKSAVEKIQGEDLDFDVEYSNIEEIDDVLVSLGKMKNELKKSLENMWKMEEERRDSLSALIHDIKTPITIISGNSELLNETDLSPEQKEYIGNIMHGLEDLENYTKTMSMINKAEVKVELKKDKINLKEFMSGILKEAAAMSHNKNLNIVSDFNLEHMDIELYNNRELFKRAVLNIISNAAEYTPENGTISIDVNFLKNYKNEDCIDKLKSEQAISIAVEDSGRGFSNEEIKCAREKFYRGDKSRNSKSHFGMGLYIVDKFAKESRGKLILCNGDKYKGAKVELIIPLLLQS